MRIKTGWNRDFETTKYDDETMIFDVFFKFSSKAFFPFLARQKPGVDIFGPAKARSSAHFEQS